MSEDYRKLVHERDFGANIRLLMEKREISMEAAIRIAMRSMTFKDVCKSAISRAPQVGLTVSEFIRIVRLR